MGDDEQLISDAAQLAGIVGTGEQLEPRDVEFFAVLLREMRAETETIRLSRRMMTHFRIPPPPPTD